jgi:drug/metabolite transporter (DMT)-like permease
MKQINQSIVLSWIFLLSLAIIWGVNFLFIKLAVLEVGPITNVFLRLTIAALILYVCMIATGNKLKFGKNYVIFYFAIGALGLAIPFFLISSAEQNIDAGLAGVLMSPMPLLTLALSALILRNEKINFLKVLSFFIAAFGLVVLLGFENLSQLGGKNRIEFFSQLAVLLAASCYGLNAIISKLVPEINFISLATGVTTASVIIILPFSIIYEPFWLEEFGIQSIIAISVQGIFATAIANLLFFKIIELEGPVFLSLINFMIPLIAYFSGVAFLGETIKINVLVSLGLILFALYLNHRS